MHINWLVFLFVLYWVFPQSSDRTWIYSQHSLVAPSDYSTWQKRSSFSISFSCTYIFACCEMMCWGRLSCPIMSHVHEDTVSVIVQLLAALSFLASLLLMRSWCFICLFLSFSLLEPTQHADRMLCWCVWCMTEIANTLQWGSVAAPHSFLCDLHILLTICNASSNWELAAQPYTA